MPFQLEFGRFYMTLEQCELQMFFYLAKLSVESWHLILGFVDVCSCCICAAVPWTVQYKLCCYAYESMLVLTVCILNASYVHTGFAFYVLFSVCKVIGLILYYDFD